MQTSSPIKVSKNIVKQLKQSGYVKQKMIYTRAYE